MDTVPTGRDGREIFAKSVAVCIGVCLANEFVELYLRARIHESDFRWAIAFITTQSCAVACLSLYLISLRVYSRLVGTLHDHIRPPIRDRVLALGLEGESWSSQVPTHGPARRVLEESVADALTTFKGSARDRIARFAVEQGFETYWVKAFAAPSQAERKRAISLLALISRVAGETLLPVAIENRYPAIRAVAYRGLLILGNSHRVDGVFHALMRESFLVRALLVNELKRHAPHLMASTIPSFLKSASRAEAARCFETLLGWQSALPSFAIYPWITQESDRVLWPLVLALLPYVATDNSIESFIVSALDTNDLASQCAAAEAAGRLRLHGLIPRLSAALSADNRLGAASAYALARMGGPGERRLEQVITGADRKAAAFALEALERTAVKGT